MCNVLPPWTVEGTASEGEARENFAFGLNQREGFKSSNELLLKWFENLAPYEIENKYLVIGPVKEDQYAYLKTITFYVNPDQLSLLIHGAEYNNASMEHHPVVTAFGSGCGRLRGLWFQARLECGARSRLDARCGGGERAAGGLCRVWPLYGAIGLALPRPCGGL